MTGQLRIAYLSGSPRISTRDDAGVSGPRAHILGLIGALRRQGHVVEQFVLGDRVTARLSKEGVQGSATGGFPRQLAVDVVRLCMRNMVARRATAALAGSFDVAYERAALFQELGRRFQATGAVWIVESNAVISQEARLERNALALQRVASWLERRTYRRADLVVCVSDSLRQLLMDELGLPADKLLVLPNAVDTSRFRADGAPAGDAVRKQGLVVGFVGFVIERQGLRELILAVAALRRGGAAVRVEVVGDGPDLASLRELTRRERVEDGVTFRGQVPWSRIPDAISRFSVGYSGQRGVSGMPMYHSPLKIYEYMAMGRPIIASDHADARTATDAGAGWTFAPGDVAALTRVLEQVVSLSPDEVDSVGRRARRHVDDFHTWDHRGRLLVDEIRSRGLL